MNHGEYWSICYKAELLKTNSKSKARKYADLMEKYRKNGVPLPWAGFTNKKGKVKSLTTSERK